MIINCLKTIITLLYPLLPLAIPPKFLLPALALLTLAPVDSILRLVCPFSNLNPRAPAVGVRVANGLPERSFASANLASTPSLPPAAMQGRVMPSFPHTLIGLGPFANLGCQILFTKTAVSIIHPDGHTILKGWREVDSPPLWCFQLQATKSSLPATTLFDKYEEPGPRGSAVNFLPAPPIIPIQCPPVAPMPPPCKPSPTASTALLHSSQEFSDVGDAGKACFVSYQYRSAQALACLVRHNPFQSLQP